MNKVILLLSQTLELEADFHANIDPIIKESRELQTFHQSHHTSQLLANSEKRDHLLHSLINIQKQSSHQGQDTEQVFFICKKLSKLGYRSDSHFTYGNHLAKIISTQAKELGKQFENELNKAVSDFETGSLLEDSPPVQTLQLTSAVCALVKAHVSELFQFSSNIISQHSSIDDHLGIGAYHQITHSLSHAVSHGCTELVSIWTHFIRLPILENHVNSINSVILSTQLPKSLFKILKEPQHISISRILHPRGISLSQHDATKALESIIEAICIIVGKTNLFISWTTTQIDSAPVNLDQDSVIPLLTSSHTQNTDSTLATTTPTSEKPFKDLQEMILELTNPFHIFHLYSLNFSLFNAFTVETINPSSRWTTIVDDIFYILKHTVSTVFSSGSPSLVSSVLLSIHSAISLDIFPVLKTLVNQELRFRKIQSSSSIFKKMAPPGQPDKMISSSLKDRIIGDGSLPKRFPFFLLQETAIYPHIVFYLNNIHKISSSLQALVAQIEQSTTNMNWLIVNKQKILTISSSFTNICKSFDNFETKKFKEMIKIISIDLQPILSLFPKIPYQSIPSTLSCPQSDLFTQKLEKTWKEISNPLEECLLSSQKLFNLVAKYIAEDIQKKIFSMHFSSYGVFRFDKDVRVIISMFSLTSNVPTSVFRRLKEMATILTMEKQEVLIGASNFSFTEQQLYSLLDRKESQK